MKLCQCCLIAIKVEKTYTTVRVINGVHGNTTSLGPAVALDSELVLGTRGLCLQLLAKFPHPKSGKTCGLLKEPAVFFFFFFCAIP